MPDDTRDVSSMPPGTEASETDGRGTASDPSGWGGSGERAPNTLLNVLIGGVAAVVLSGIPFSTVLGGGVASYLEGGTYEHGAKVGAAAGVVAFLPLVGIFAVFVLFVSVPDPTAGLGFGLLGVVVLFFAAVYTVGLSALGGVLGIYVRRETSIGAEPRRDARRR